DYSAGRDLPNGMVPGIGHINISAAVHDHTLRSIKLGIEAGPVETIGAPGGPGQCANCARRRDPANGMVSRVCHIDVVGTVNGDALRSVEARVTARAIGAAWVPGG